jgi:predicted acetyltransferase
VLLPGSAGNIQLRLGHGEDLEYFAGHVGYYVAPAHRGKRYAQRSCALLLELARWHGMSTLWITCNPENAASRRTAERLGAQLTETIELPLDNPQRLENGETAKCRYRLPL